MIFKLVAFQEVAVRHVTTCWMCVQNTCQDEAETMQACQDYAECGKRVVSPHLKHVLSMDMEEKRQLWQSWSDEVNEDGKRKQDQSHSDTGNFRQ